MRRPETTAWRPALLAIGGVALLAAGCGSVGPDYRRPEAETPSAYKEAGDWQPSQPRDAAERGAWWAVFGDPVLDGLERQVEVSNQNLKAAEAAYREALYAVDVARAGYQPTLTATAGAQRSGRGSVQGAPAGGAQVGNHFELRGDASWTLDVWGRIRRTVESSEAQAQASAGDLASARLLAQGTLAIDYLTLRANDELGRILQATDVAYARSLDITRNQHEAGLVSRADVAQAEAQLATLRSQAVAIGVQRSQLEHAIAVLTGHPPSALSIAPIGTMPDVPAIPAQVPSTLLERRPDIAAAERRMAAANAQIGVAISAYYPDLTLTASLDYASSTIGTLLKAANALWSVGPQLAGTLYDGGLRSAQVGEARAAYDATVANYRQTVLDGFQQVEDQLSALRLLGKQAEVQELAVTSSQEAEERILNQYKAGTVSYTSVITAQTVSLSSRQSALSIRQSRLAAAVTLIQGLGGGWDASQLDPKRQH